MMGGFLREILIPGWLAVMLLISSCAVQTAPASQPGTLLRLCYTALTASQIPVLYAQEAGIFEAHGLEVELIYFESGTTAATALIADEVDICQIAGSAVVNAAVAGEDLVIIAGLINTYVYSLVVTPDIQQAEDLRGKAVAVSRIGSSSDSAIRIALQSMGLVPDEEVAIVAIGDQGARLAALETGQIAGTVISVPASDQAMEGGFHELLDMATLDAPFQHTAIATSRSFIENRPDEAQAFMDALLEALRMIKSDREGSIHVMAEYLQLDPTRDQVFLSNAYDQLIVKYLQEVPYPTEEGIQALLDQAAGENPAAAEFNSADVLDLSLLTEAIQRSDER